MRHAYLEIGTFADLTDLITLLRQGATVGVSARSGLLFGPMLPGRLFVGCPKLAGCPPVMARYDHRIDATDPEAFLHAYFDRHEIFTRLVVPETEAVPFIREMWTILNRNADGPLSRLSIIRIALVLQRWIGTGVVEPQMVYGDPDWMTFVREGLGHLVMPYKPSAKELQEIALYGAKGVVVAETALAEHPWFAGMSGSFPLPDHGLVDHDPTHTPEQAFEAATAPSGVSRIWDRVRTFLPLSGLLRGLDEDPEAFRATGLETMTIFKGKSAKSRQGRPMAKLVITRAHPSVPRKQAGAWLMRNWGNVFRVDFV